MNPYRYPSDEPRFNLELKQTTSGWSCYTVDFPSAHPTPYEESNTARGEYFLPRSAESAPLVILLHGMGDISVIPCRLLARTLAKRGIACFVLYLVFHSNRLPEALRERLPNDLTPEEWFEGYRASVINTRQVVDWAGTRPEINKEHIGVIGISLGGFISSIAMGIDNRIKAGVFLVTGGNSEKIVQKARLTAFRKRYKRTEAEYNDIQNAYAQYLGEAAEKGFENVTPARKSFLTDPMTFAPRLRQRPILMLNALWDEFIPKQTTLDLWEACERPAIVWFPATHVAIWLWYPVIKGKIARFLSATFDGQHAGGGCI